MCDVGYMTSKQVIRAYKRECALSRDMDRFNKIFHDAIDLKDPSVTTFD